MRDAESRVCLLGSGLGFLRREPELQLLHDYLDSWSDVGHVVAGMARQNYDLELRRYNGQAGTRRAESWPVATKERAR